jgi:hypothetical protein
LFIFFSFYKKRCLPEKLMHHNNLLFLKKATFFFGKARFFQSIRPGIIRREAGFPLSAFQEAGLKLFPDSRV